MNTLLRSLKKAAAVKLRWLKKRKKIHSKYTSVCFQLANKCAIVKLLFMHSERIYWLKIKYYLFWQAHRKKRKSMTDHFRKGRLYSDPVDAKFWTTSVWKAITFDFTSHNVSVEQYFGRKKVNTPRAQSILDIHEANARSICKLMKHCESVEN